MSDSVIVVGAGLAGLTAALLARSRGLEVRIIAEGRGSLSLSHGCVDVWRDGPLSGAAGDLSPHHPLRRAGSAGMQAALDEFLTLIHAAGLPYHAATASPLRLPTATGSIHQTTAAPFSLANGSLDETGPIHIGRIPEIRDFSAGLVASGLRSRGVANVAVVDLPLPPAAAGRDASPQRIASRLDRPSVREALCRDWAPRLRGVRRLGLPALLGLAQPAAVLADLEARLGISLFEIPTLPPSLPGLRLEQSLRRLCTARGIQIVEGPSVRGEVDGRSAGRRASGVVAATAGGPRRFLADSIVLATGGALNGGWLGFASGEVQDSVFGLPLDAPADREQWVTIDPFEPQAFARFGLRVDSRQRPIDPRGRVYFENLFAAGGILAGADRTREGSRQGIDLASAYLAARGIAG